METPHYGFFPPAGEVIDETDPRVMWIGNTWVLEGQPYSPPSSHALIGRPGGPLQGWYYDFGRRAWIEPEARNASPLRPGGPARPRTPIRRVNPNVVRFGPQPMPMPQPQAQPMPMPMPQPQPPAPMPEKEIEMVEKKDKNVLEYLMKHPVAPVLGGFLLIGAQFAEEPVPPQIPDDLPEAVAKQWQMIYAQNLQRFQRRMSLWENVGKVLLGYADTNAVLAALPKKALP